MPCATCKDGLPSVCLTCFGGAKLNGTTCTQDISCNKFNNCTNCGQGNGYILLGANCLRCSANPNCLQCRPTNSKACSLCATGFYINSADTCSSCPNNCVSCISSSVCTGCTVGYTFSDGYVQGQCLPCTAPCVTCYGSQTYCTSCKSGYTKNGWKCLSNLNVGFSVSLTTDDLAAVLTAVDQIVAQMLTYLGISHDKVDAITFSSIKHGSVNINGFATPTTVSSTTVSSSTSSLSSGLSSSSLGGFSVGSSSVVSNGVNNSSTSNLPLIIGLSVGIPLFIGNYLII
jgi:hypothetical protein